MSDAKEHPSLIGGHAQYIKAQAEAAIGSVTGSEEWKAAGEKDRQSAVDTMKAAGENRDPQTSGLGKVEEQAGKLVGCEGMEKEGAQSQ